MNIDPIQELTVLGSVRPLRHDEEQYVLAVLSGAIAPLQPLEELSLSDDWVVSPVNVTPNNNWRGKPDA